MIQMTDTDTMQEKHIRPSRDEYFMEVCQSVAKRATCDRGRSWCLIARDHQILVTWYVWAPRWLPHCDDVWHLLKEVKDEDWHTSMHCMRTVHAEQNAICQAAKLWISLEWATLYCKMTPCRACAMMIINCWIKRIMCEKKYHAGSESEEMFKQAWIQLEFVNEEVEQYKNM